MSAPAAATRLPAAATKLAALAALVATIALPKTAVLAAAALPVAAAAVLLMTSTTRLIANKKVWAGEPAKREKIENIALLLQGAINAREKVGLKLNAPRDAVDAITRLLPAEKSPTVSPLADGSWVAMEVIVEEKSERDLIPKLKRAGATGLITYPLNKVIP